MKKFGLIGNKISYSLSPQIHGIIYRELKTNASYELIDIESGKLKERICELSRLNGFNVTQPHKIAITEFLAENNSPIGAVNTVKVSGGKLCGYNTDVFGFRRDVENNFGSLFGAAALIVGAGGMAEAAAYVLLDAGADVYIKNRTAEKAEALCERSGAQLFRSGLKPNIIVNCSSAELFGGEVDLSGVDATQLKFAYDTIYKQTKFVSALTAVGVTAVNGLDMLIYQAVRAAEIFTDIKIGETQIEKLKNTIRSELQL